MNKVAIKELRYQVMLALYLPILLYSFSTYDLSEDTFAVREIRPIVVGEETIVLGQPYEARAYLTAANKVELESVNESMEALGDSLLRMATGDLLAADEDVKTIEYEADLVYEQVNQELGSRRVKGSFTVRRPELVATSEATQAMYRRTLNQIRIDVPGLENRTLKLESAGRTTEGRSIALSPSGNSVEVNAYLADSTSGDVYLGSKQFSVIDPPRPEIKVVDARGKEMTSGDAIQKARPVIEFQIIPDREFQQSYPRDARYQIRRAKISIRQGLAASKEIGTFNLETGNTLKLVQQLRDARPKDQLIVQLEGIVRINHAGEAIPVQLSEGSRSFSFVVS